MRTISGLKAMLNLARRYRTGPVLIAVIAEQE
jgi:hypothetical protein